MLKINKVAHLASRLGVTSDVLIAVADNVDRYVVELAVVDPSDPGNPRPVINVIKPLRLIQSRIYRRLLLPILVPSIHSHGGVAQRHIKSNIGQHVESAFVLTTDITKFYPTIHYKKVYTFFFELMECAPDVARLLTRLCTHNRHLALGLSTSPIIADRLMGGIDRRIGQACAEAQLVYSRFVDDISISGAFSLDPKTSGMSALAVKILNQNGFRISKRKHKFGRMKDGFTITSLRCRRGRIDVSQQYVIDLASQFADAQKLERGEKPDGLYFSQSQLRGRVEFAAWINPARRLTLMRQFRSINWNLVHENAAAMGIVSAKKRLVPVNPRKLKR